jgi:heme-degrading monooxygenase HmoA
MYLTIRFTGERQAAGLNPISTATPVNSGRLPRSLLFLRDDSLDFDRGKYGSSGYIAMEVGAPRKTADGPADAGDAHLCRQVRRACVGLSPNSESIFFITTCEMDDRESERFLAQFDRASAFLREQSGFLGFRLLKAHDPATALRFVNIARWSSIEEFVLAFSSAEFKACITGGFDHQSQIMVARQMFTCTEQVGPARPCAPFGVKPGVQTI